MNKIKLLSGLFLILVLISCSSGNIAQYFAEERRNVRFKKVKEMIDDGAKVDASSDTGSTALTYAVFYKKVKIAKLLIDKRANVNFVNQGEINKGDTPLMSAVSGKCLECVELLVKNGVDINTKKGKLKAIDYAEGEIKEYLESLAQSVSK